MKLPPSVTLEEPSPGYPVLVINHPAACGRLALHGAHLMEWRPAGGHDVLYMSPRAEPEPGEARRGGVPVCWPWFGPHPADAAKPAHGFARRQLWQLAGAMEEGDGVTLELALRESAATLAEWPHRFELRLAVRLGAELELRLLARNTDETAWTMTAVLHTYLAVEDARAAEITGLEGASYVEERLSPRSVESSGSVRFDREVDRAYHSSGSVRLIDHAGGREIEVLKGGSGVTVVWNPWIEKSRRLADLPETDYLKFVCIEAANQGPDVVRLPPGREHLLWQTLRPVR